MIDRVEATLTEYAGNIRVKRSTACRGQQARERRGQLLGLRHDNLMEVQKVLTFIREVI